MNGDLFQKLAIYEHSQSKQTGLKILDIFDNGVVHSLLENEKIDSPYNAMCLTKGTSRVHALFGSFEICFLPDSTVSAPNAYQVVSMQRYLPDPTFPIKVTINDTLQSRAPHPRLLAIHAAISRIMKMSAAREHIGQVLRDAEDTVVRSDGGTDLGCLVRYGLYSTETVSVWHHVWHTWQNLQSPAHPTMICAQDRFVYACSIAKRGLFILCAAHDDTTGRCAHVTKKYELIGDQYCAERSGVANPGTAPRLQFACHTTNSNLVTVSNLLESGAGVLAILLIMSEDFVAVDKGCKKEIDTGVP